MRPHNPVSDRYLKGNYRRVFDLLYSEKSPACALDLWLPADAEGPLPVILFFHGGGFSYGSKREGQSEPVLRALDHGFAVADCNYRLVPEALFPEIIYDARNAVRYVRSIAGTYGLDPGRVIAWGASSGAWLAAMLALTENNERFAETAPEHPEYSCHVDAVIDWCGPCGDFGKEDSDFEVLGIPAELSRTDPNAPECRFLGCCPKDDPALSALSAPCSYARRDAPPFLIVHGRDDTLVPCTQSERLAESLWNAGAYAEFCPVPGLPHHSPCWTDCETVNAATLGFLDRLFKPEKNA